MRPLLERLRFPDYEHGGTGGPCLDHHSVCKAMCEAADEIEQLQENLRLARLDRDEAFRALARWPRQSLKRWWEFWK